jgi:hypothetical protein
MSEVVPLTREERIEERCGRLLLVGCSNSACGNREWAHRWDREPQVDWSPDGATTAAARAGTKTAGGKDERRFFPSCSVVFIVIERLSFPCMDRGIGTAVPVKTFRISNQFLNFHSKRGRMRPVEKFSEDEHQTFTEKRGARSAHEFLAAASAARSYRKLFKVEGKEELLGIGPPTPGAG